MVRSEPELGVFTRSRTNAVALRLPLAPVLVSLVMRAYLLPVADGMVDRRRRDA